MDQPRLRRERSCHVELASRALHSYGGTGRSPRKSITGVSSVEEESEAAFRVFVTQAEPRLRRALIAAYGYERGREGGRRSPCLRMGELGPNGRDRKSQRAISSGWDKSRTRRRKTPVLFGSPTRPGSAVRTAGRALHSPHCRNDSVWRSGLAHGAGWTHAEIAELTGVKASTVQKHVERGLAHLRRVIGSKEK